MTEETPAASSGGVPKSAPAGSDVAALAPGRRPGLSTIAVVVVCLAAFLSALDQMVVVTALAPMTTDLNVPITEPDRVAWIVSGYLLGYVIAMPLMGRLADLLGRRRIFVTCLLIFALGSCVAALAPDLGAPLGPDPSSLGGAVLTPLYNAAQGLIALAGSLGIDTSSPSLDLVVAARFAQALGGGALVPVAMAVLGDLYGGSRRGLALGLVGAVTEAGGVLGPLWGAWITDAFGWRWIFWLNLPFAGLLLVAGLLVLRRVPRVRESIDVLGTLVFGAALLCLTVGLGQQSGQLGALNVHSRATMDPRFLGVALLLLVVFVLIELRARWPVMSPRLFRAPAFSGAVALSLLVGVALIVALVEIPLYLASLTSATPVEAGLALLRMTALIPVGAVVGGWLAGRFGCPPAAVAGTVLAAIGLYLMHLWPAQVGWGQVTVAAVIAGLGFGLVIAPISTSALNAARASEAGVAASVVTMMRMTGMILGLAGLTSFGLARLRALVASNPLPATASQAEITARLNSVLHQVYADVFLVAAVLVLVGVIPALFLWRRGANADAQRDKGTVHSYVAPLA